MHAPIAHLPVSVFLRARVSILCCRGLFESHKMIFSFLIVTSIQRNSGAVAPAQWDFLLRGGREPDRLRPVPPALAGVLTPAAWLQVQCAERCVPELGVLGSALETQVRGGGMLDRGG